MPDPHLTQTLEPHSLRASEADPSAEVMAVVEILFHSDLRRVGERHALGGVSSMRHERVIGRDAPLFTRPGEHPIRSLADPCISRRQALVRWSPDRMQFTVLPEPDAKRAVALFDLAGRRLGAPPMDVPPGTLLAIGDRVLLLLTVRPAEPACGDLQMVGASGAMSALRHRIATLADLPDTVLVRGETGSGKELVAQGLHIAGRRRGGPLLAVNCAALPEALMESELFGYVKGAYSGAAQGRDGLFMAAQGGTLFLDEIGELPLATQAKLLRVLEVRRVRPVGGQSEVAIDTRVVAATNRDLAEEVRKGRFREDLYSRIEAPVLVVPPLRERREDIPLLFASFLWRRTLEQAQALGKPWPATPLARLWREADQDPPALSMDAMFALLRADWPRNVRELAKHVSELVAQRDPGAALAFPPPLGAPPPATLPPVSSPAPGPREAPAARPSADDPGRQRPTEAELVRVLEEHDHVQQRAAKALGVPYTTLDRWMRELGVVRPRDLTLAAIEQASRQAGGDLVEAARLLRVSVRGLRSRRKELGLEPE